MEYLDKTGLAHFWGKAKTKIEASSINKVYPVGSIYMSVSSTSPASLFGGTWEQIKDRFMLACGDTYTAGSTGGEALHTLTVNEMPTHNHGFQRAPIRSAEMSGPNSGEVFAYTGTTYRAYIADTQTSGGNEAHNNMPPYVAVYVWKRVS